MLPKTHTPLQLAPLTSPLGMHDLFLVTAPQMDPCPACGSVETVVQVFEVDGERRLFGAWCRACDGDDGTKALHLGDEEMAEAIKLARRQILGHKHDPELRLLARAIATLMHNPSTNRSSW